jgi:hypothetical protein
MRKESSFEVLVQLSAAALLEHQSGRRVLHGDENRGCSGECAGGVPEVKPGAVGGK